MIGYRHVLIGSKKQRDFVSIFTEGTGSVQYPNSSSNVYNNLKLQNFSIEFYVNIYKNTIDYAGGIAHGLIYSTNVSHSWFVSFANSKVSINATNVSNNTILILSTSVLSLNTTYKIKIEINNGTAKMYVDNVLDASTTFSGTIDYTRTSLSNFDSFTLGGRPSPINTLAFNGTLDEVIITDLDTDTVKFNSVAVYSGVDLITGDTGIVTDVTQGAI